MRRWLAIVALCALGACAKSSTTAPPDSRASGTGTVGYVRMGELVKHHPLYSQLAQYEANIEALNLSATVPHVAKPDAAIAKEEAQLEKELGAAADRTKKLLDDKQKQYQQRESQAIAEALRSAARGGGSVGGIQQQIQSNANRQVSGVAAQAQRDLESYRKTIEAQDRAEIDAANKALADRASRTFRAKQDELQSKESALTLEFANKDASERLSLRTKLSSLALDDAEREDARAKLAALDRRESDALAAMKNRDTQTLAALQSQLRDQVERDIQARANEIHQRSIAKLKAREVDVRRQFGGGPAIATTLQNGKPTQQVNPNLPPDLRAKLTQLHENYQKQFTADAKSTIEDFNKTRNDLKKRYDALRGVDAAAQNGAQAQVASLQRKRNDLYGQMVAQIGREVRLIAQQRGISVVVTDPYAGGVDLTPDAMKDIESLHE